MLLATYFDVVIVGGGHGGAQAAIALRGAGFDGSIVIIGREADMPYERPALSKEYLGQERPFDQLYMRSTHYWDEKNISFMLGRSVTAIDAVRHLVSCSDGAEIGYGKLIWAAGGDPRPLPVPGFDLVGVQVVRDREDVDAILGQLSTVDNVAIIGGGYIGLEAAAVLSTLGRKVVLLEALPRLLARVAGKNLSNFYEAYHRDHGVDVRLDQNVVAIEGDKRVSGVRLADGEIVSAQMVIVGIGIIPCIEPLASAGAQCGNGVLVDAQCRTSLADIYAIGDCAAHANRFAGGNVVRLESVQNANDMATTVARTICGEEASYSATPWFWSDQYDLKLQTVGLPFGSAIEVVRGDTNTRKFSVVYLDTNDRVVALDCVNNARDYSHGRRLVELGVAVDPLKIGDAQRQLKEWIPAITAAS